MSCYLFYGPDSYRKTLEKSKELGKLVGSFGEEGLKVEEAREVVSLIQSPPFVGSGLAVVVVGPMDQSRDRSSDVLLKSIEEFDHKIVQPLLWAYDLGEVRPTVRSRSLAVWCPSDDFFPEPPLVDKVDDLFEALAQRDVFLIGEILKGIDDYRGLLDAFSYVAFRDQSEFRLKVWESLRPLTFFPEPTQYEFFGKLFDFVRG